MILINQSEKDESHSVWFYASSSSSRGVEETASVAVVCSNGNAVAVVCGLNVGSVSCGDCGTGSPTGHECPLCPSIASQGLRFPLLTAPRFRVLVSAHTDSVVSPGPTTRTHSPASMLSSSMFFAW
eukprot:m.138797 g.138797  ORF g.138797 m.138797 type:complete len:126 (+) comp52545_c0_seq1:462-839(+)